MYYPRGYEMLETRLPCGDQWKAEKLGALWRLPITRCFIKSDSAGLIIDHYINFRLNGEHWRAVQLQYVGLWFSLCQGHSGGLTSRNFEVWPMLLFLNAIDALEGFFKDSIILCHTYFVLWTGLVVGVLNLKFLNLLACICSGYLKTGLCGLFVFKQLQFENKIWKTNALSPYNATFLRQQFHLPSFWRNISDALMIVTSSAKILNCLTTKKQTTKCRLQNFKKNYVQAISYWEFKD